jgi:hypothetical protein
MLRPLSPSAPKTLSWCCCVTLHYLSSKVQTLSLSLPPLSPHNLSPLPIPRLNIALKFLRHTKEPRRHLLVHFHHLAILSRLLTQIKTPQYPSDIDEKRPLSNMYTRTYPTTCTVGKMVSRRRIRGVDVVCCRGRVVEIA